MVLTNVSSGNIWATDVKVSNINDIQPLELTAMFNGGTFRRVELNRAATFKDFKPQNKVGMKYRNNTGEDYILARVEDNVVALISLNNGNRYTKPVTLIDSNEITDDEFSQLCDGNEYKVTLINKE